MHWLKTTLFSLLTLTAANTFAVDPIYTPWNSNLAIKGYDTVAYFTRNQPVEGSRDFEVEWQGATWRFASAEHRELFVSAPEEYAPQYGGYCAYAISKNSTAGIDPSQFSIVDGKLYLNFSKSVQSTWLQDQATLILRADQNWPSILTGD